VAPDVGGGFGMKGGPYPEDALVLMASRRIGRPVKWTSTRAEALQGDAHGRDQVVTGELAFDENNKIIGIRAQSMHAVGSHVTGAAFATSMFSVKLLSGVYDVPAGVIFAKAVLTHTSPMAPYRGAGRPEATYLVERLIDKAAAELKVDPIQLRRKNFVPATKMPYTNTSGVVYDSGDFAKVTEECLKLADHKGFAQRRKESKSNGKLRGFGLAYFLEKPRSSTSAWICASIRAAKSRSWPARIHTARAMPRCIRRWWRNGSACRLRTSASFRAIPTRCQSGAVPTARAA
jgi:Aerobic-type carbon monoxide dehydrogenase, large subunit CoxL/CutL homologs